MKNKQHHHLSGPFVHQVMVFLFCLFIGQPLIAQESNRSDYPDREFQLKVNPDVAFSTKAPSFQHTRSLSFELSDKGIWLPEFARENPAGHAPLCRMEVHLENHMTIPLWIRAGEFDSLPQFGSGNLYVRMKLLRF